MGSEKSLWSTMRRNVGAFDGVLLQRHEDFTSDGVPDLAGIRVEISAQL